ncbi:hypothetical protein [Nocardia wallacei]|uniref:Uncharacterized protein n=1 Tax=Nocardia wallacei TaxID=480035 RepID=A0A7G1KT07_9NOCA|nr:hypothetical protein [Nocardia wallacei]BCK58365.1 hypothetical protein NWFMUON74_61370 [Nocardia wallacei]
MTAIRAVLVQYARLNSAGHPVRCRPSRAERTAGKTHPDGKVIFDRLDDAMSAAIELQQLTGEAKRAYRCNRSRHEHFHLTRDQRQRARRQTEE